MMSTSDAPPAVPLAATPTTDDTTITSPAEAAISTDGRPMTPVSTTSTVEADESNDSHKGEGSSTPPPARAAGSVTSSKLWSCLLCTKSLGPFLLNHELRNLSSTAKDLVPFIEQAWQLKTWGPAVGEAMASGRLPAVTRIRVEHKRLGGQGVAQLSMGLERHCRVLTTLCLWNTGLGAEGAKVLALGLQASRGTGAHHQLPLQHISLGYNGVGDEGATVLAALALPALGTGLKTLAMVNNDIQEEGAEALMASLSSHCPNLYQLNLRSNSISAGGVKAVATALPSLPSLLSLDLTHNSGGADGFLALGRALPRCPRLVVLRLGDNHAMDEGTRGLAHGLMKMPCLQTLDLSGNYISQSGLNALADSLRNGCPQLMSLVLSGNMLGRQAGTDLLHSLRATKACPHLVKVVVAA